MFDKLLQRNFAYRGIFGFFFSSLIFLVAAYAVVMVWNPAPNEGTIFLCLIAVSFFSVSIAVGAALSGASFFGTIGFLLSGTIFGILYILSSLRPFLDNIPDTVAATFITVAGSAIAGSIGALTCSRLKWQSGALAFGMAATSLIVIWWLTNLFRPEPPHFQLLLGPWVDARLELLGDRMISISSDSMRYITNLGYFLPTLIVLPILGYFLSQQYANQLKTPDHKASWLSTLAFGVKARNFFFILLVVAPALLLTSRAITQSSSLSRMRALHEIDVEFVRRSAFFTIEREKFLQVKFGHPLQVALIAKSAFDQIDSNSRSEEFASLIEEIIDFHTKYPAKLTSSEGLDLFDFAWKLSEFGEQKFVRKLLDQAYDSTTRSESTKAENFIAIYYAEKQFGNAERAQRALQSARKLLSLKDWHQTTLLAQAIYSSGNVEDAKIILFDLAKNISKVLSAEPQKQYLLKTIEPSSGQALYRTGAWASWPQWKSKLDQVGVDIAFEVIRDGSVEEGLHQIFGDRKNSYDKWKRLIVLLNKEIEGGNPDLVIKVLRELLEPRFERMSTSYDVAELIMVLYNKATAEENSSSTEHILKLARDWEKHWGEQVRFGELFYIYAFSGLKDKLVPKDSEALRDSTLVLIAQALRGRGDLDGANLYLKKAWASIQKTYTGMYSNPDKSKLLHKIGIELSELGAHSAAQFVSQELVKTTYINQAQTSYSRSLYQQDLQARVLLSLAKTM